MHSAYHAQTIRTTCLLLAHHADPQGQQSRRVPRNLKVNPLAVRWTPVRALRFLKSKFSLPCLRIGRRKGRKGGGGGAAQGTQRPAFAFTQSLNCSTLLPVVTIITNRVGPCPWSHTYSNSLPTSFHVPVNEHSSLQ